MTVDAMVNRHGAEEYTRTARGGKAASLREIADTKKRVSAPAGDGHYHVLKTFGYGFTINATGVHIDPLRTPY